MNIFAGNIEGNTAYLWEDEVVHCTKVLRKRVGDEIVVTDGKGTAIQGKILEISKKAVKVAVQSSIELPSQISPLHIAMALTKNIDRFEFFIEKATELGVVEITPLVSFHSERKTARLDKLEKKAIAASKQSLRATFLKVNEVTNFQSFLSQNTENQLYIAHCNDALKRTPITQLNPKNKTTILIGPEGDFSNEEIAEAIESHHATALSLGPNRLRTETAGIYVASYFYGALR